MRRAVVERPLVRRRAVVGQAVEAPVKPRVALVERGEQDHRPIRRRSEGPPRQRRNEQEPAQVCVDDAPLPRASMQRHRRVGGAPRFAYMWRCVTGTCGRPPTVFESPLTRVGTVDVVEVRPPSASEFEENVRVLLCGPAAEGVPPLRRIAAAPAERAPRRRPGHRREGHRLARPAGKPRLLRSIPARRVDLPPSNHPTSGRRREPPGVRGSRAAGTPT
mmetsp:Transcript_21476/g.72808  ORF Transcript_21476/g.72808 Transcript_21476/m.72808 type:complete len:219 (-) Transcript_21476:30-686(-)